MRDLLAVFAIYIYMVVTDRLLHFVYKKIDTREHVMFPLECVVKLVNVLSHSNFNMHACHYVLSIMTMMYATRVNDFCWTNNFFA